MTPSENTENSRSGMLERACAILQAFRPNDVTVSPATLTKRAGLPKATGHRIIMEMINLGMLERTVGGVRLGMLMFEIGQLVPRQRFLRRVALPVMADLRESTRLTVHLAVLEHGDVLYVEILSYRRDLPSRVGGRMPAYATAVGKAMLAHATNDIVESVLRKRFRKFGPHTISSPEALERELQDIRVQGLAYEREESAKGIACVGAPILGVDGELQGGLSLTGPSTDFDPRRVAAAVRTAAMTLGRLIDRDVVTQQQTSAMLAGHQEGTSDDRR